MREGSVVRPISTIYSVRRFLFTTHSWLTNALPSSTSSRIEVDLQSVMVMSQANAATSLELKRAFELAGRHTSQLGVPTSSMAAFSVPTSSRNNPTQAPGADMRMRDNSNGPTSDENSLPLQPFHYSGSALFESSQMTAVSAVGIRVAQFPRMPCTPWCSCSCHTETHLRSPHILDSIFGALFIGYSGAPSMRKAACDQPSCHLQAQPMSCMTYFFPRWFLARAVSITLASTPLAGPVASLKFQRTVPGSADIFTYAKVGDVNGMKRLFQNGMASPHDIHYESGVTALHVSFPMAKLAIMQAD